MIGRRYLLGSAAGLAAGTVAGEGGAAGAAEAAVVPVGVSASGTGPPRDAGTFGLVGVFDVDWLPDARFTHLLDMMAASPGGFTGVRVFGALNSGTREDVAPRESGTVWQARDRPPDFSATLRALDALVSRGLVPFLALTFFPRAVSPTPITPPDDFAAWEELVAAFLDALAARYGPGEIARWRFEAWNEPNMPPFWGGDFDRYLDLYRATSAAVRRSGHALRLGGPAIAWLPGEGPTLMERFLVFLAREPEVKCDFLSYHRKGIWTAEETEPRLERLAAAAEFTARAARRLVPDRLPGLAIVNDEADMKVGFDQPYAPRMGEQFPAWLAGAMLLHEDLARRHGIPFVAAADDANQQLVRGPFDGRRSVATVASDSPTDLVKLPVWGFYELLRLFGGRDAPLEAPPSALFPATGLLLGARVSDAHLAVLATNCAAGGDRRSWRLDLALRGLPWAEINVACFVIDATRSNAFAAGGRLSPAPGGPDWARRLREAQELAMDRPLRTRLRAEGGAWRESLTLDPWATQLLWITPHDPAPPAPPAWIAAEADGANAVLRWTPAAEAGFWSYELVRLGPDGRPGPRLSPLPLRAAAWTDTAPGAGVHRYAVRSVTASGVGSALVPGPELRLPG